MKFLLLLILFSGSYCSAQSPSYWIEFTDRNNSPYFISSPNSFLSQKAIDRREKFQTPIIENDLPVNLNYIDSIVKLSNIQFVGSSKWFNAIIIKTSDTNSLNQIDSYSFVKGFRLIKSLIKKPIEKLEEFQEEKSNISITNVPHYPYGYSYSQFALHNFYQLQDMGFKGQGMQIAIIDAGFYRSNEMPGLQHLFLDNKILSTYDFVENEKSVYEDHYHGSAVLSVIAGKVDGMFLGTAPKAQFHLLRSEDAFSESLLEEFNWIRAAEYADSAGVDIINTSLGYTIFDDTSQNHTYEELNGDSTYIAKAANLASSKGILVCVSAGNSGASEWKYISTPADAKDVLAVGAADSLGEYAFFSSVGFGSSNQVKPNVSSVGWNTVLLSPFSDEIIKGNGTSFSAPMIAGMAAVLWQSLPDKSNWEIKKIIEESSSQYLMPDTLLGYGIPNFLKAYQNQENVEYQSVQIDEIEKTFPNPTSDNCNVIFKSKNDQNITVQLYNDLGNLIINNKLTVFTGKNMLKVKFTESDNRGVYTLVVTNENKVRFTTKIIII